MTYARIVFYIRPEKDDPITVRITAEGDRLEYYSVTSAETESIETEKNSHQQDIIDKKYKIHVN